MPSQHDINFAQAMGGRTVTDNKDKTLAEEPASLANRIKKARDQALEDIAVAQVYGLDVNQVSKGAATPNSEPASAVSTALNSMGNVITQANETSKEKTGEVQKARQEADDARTNLFSTQLQVIQSMQKSLIESQDKMSEHNSPEQALGIVQKWQEMLNTFQPKVAEKTVTVSPASNNNANEITLQKMRQDHETEMERLRGEREMQKEEFALRMAQFNEDTKRRYKEYDDGQKFKDNAFSGFSDLAASIAAGIDKDSSGAPVTNEPTIQAAVSAFNCQSCGTHLDVAEGAETVVCPKAGCGAEYAIKVKP